MISWDNNNGSFKNFRHYHHDLFIAKLHVYRFSGESPKLIKSYLTNRLQRTKLNTGFSKWTGILLGVPQGLHLDRFV